MFVMFELVPVAVVAEEKSKSFSIHKNVVLHFWERSFKNRFSRKFPVRSIVKLDFNGVE